MTCSACPEQYDVYRGDHKIAYLRLRHGYFRADMPDYGGKTVYEGSPQGDGAFLDEERGQFLAEALGAVHARMTGGELAEGENSVMAIDQAAKIALFLRADLDDLIAHGVRYDYDKTIRVHDSLKMLARRARDLHECLVALSPTASRARAVLSDSRLKPDRVETPKSGSIHESGGA